MTLAATSLLPLDGSWSLFTIKSVRKVSRTARRDSAAATAIVMERFLSNACCRDVFFLMVNWIS